MYSCPHCGKLSFGAWRKANATSNLPASCSRCGGLAFVSGWVHVTSHLVLEALLWGAIIAAIALKSWMALLIFPVGAVIALLVQNRVSSLKPIEMSAVVAARRASAIQFGVLVAIILVASVLSGSK